jgi:hypothetical protein
MLPEVEDNKAPSNVLTPEMKMCRFLSKLYETEYALKVSIVFSKPQ